MGKNLKIELDLPDFEKELNISVKLTRDGEGIKCSSHPSEVKTQVSNNSIPQTPPAAQPREVPQRPLPATGGNMMNMNF